MRILTTLIILFTVSALIGQEYKTVETEVLNVRAGTSTDYEILEKIYKNDKVKILNEDDEWTKIESNDGTVGFVSSEFLSSELVKEEPKENNVKEKGKYTWITTLIVFGIIGFLIIKFLDSFKGIFKSSSADNNIRNKSELKKTIVKIKPRHFYNCKNCNLTIEADKKPNPMNCSRETFHKWTDIGEVGNDTYSCKNCGTTIKTSKKPTPLHCSEDKFHKWTKLS